MALFLRPPGTGKTIAAEAIPADVARDSNWVDLAMVEYEYIGDTEKNLKTRWLSIASVPWKKYRMR